MYCENNNNEKVDNRNKVPLTYTIDGIRNLLYFLVLMLSFWEFAMFRFHQVCNISNSTV